MHPLQTCVAGSHFRPPPASIPTLQSASLLQPTMHMSFGPQYVPNMQTSLSGVHSTHAPVLVSQTGPFCDPAQSLSLVHPCIPPPAPPAPELVALLVPLVPDPLAVVF